MYSITIESYFSSAHYLRGYKGKCESLHGHNWKVEVSVEKEELDKLGMALDFKCLKAKLDKALDKLDHTCLNNIAYFKKVNPTSESIARYIYDRLEANVGGLKAVTVWESNTSRAAYYKE